MRRLCVRRFIVRCMAGCRHDASWTGKRENYRHAG
jgi:hypothetical protein